MKKIISILSVSLFAVVFAAGCGEGGGKVAKCDEAKKVKACKDGTKDNKKCVAQYRKNDDASKKEDADVEKCFDDDKAKVGEGVKAVCETLTNGITIADAATYGTATANCAKALESFTDAKGNKCVVESRATAATAATGFADAKLADTSKCLFIAAP
jgi:hypothetical protein